MNIGSQPDRIFTSCPARGVLWLLLVFLPLLATAQAVDEDFDPDADGTVGVIAVQPDGKLIIAGDFETIAGATRHRIARLNADGSLDTTFIDANVDDLIRSVALQPDGRILIGGNFQQVGSHNRLFLARLNNDGSVDEGFRVDADAAVYALAVQEDGKIVVGGKFHNVGGVARNFLARLNEGGGIDASYDPNPDSTVLTLAIQSDGRLLAGGRFNSFATPCGTVVCTVFVRRIARIDVDGSVDENFDPHVNDGDVQVIAEQPDNAIVIAGSFTSIDSQDHQSIARLTAEGSLDSFFTAIDINDAIGTLALQADGKIVVGGDFTDVDGLVRNHVARLLPDGSIDPSFDVDVDGSVATLAKQDEGALLIGGSFTSVNGRPHDHIARVISFSGQGDLTDCQATPNFIVHDDGSIENGYSGNPQGGVTEVRFVDKFTPAAYPMTYNEVCVGLITISGPATYAVEIVVFDDDGPGGEPGTELGSLATTVTMTVVSVPIPPDTMAFWNRIDISSLGLEVTDGSVYIGARWAPIYGGLSNVFIAADQSTDRPAGFAEGYWWNNNDPVWTPIEQGFGGYRALMVRAGRNDTIFRDGFESP